MSIDRKLPNWIDAWMEYTNNVETSNLYRKWVGLMCVSSALQRKVKVEWGVGLTFYPNLYIVLVGKSAAGKGTAMRPALNIIKQIPAIKLSAQATSLQALISSLKNNNLADVNADGTTIFHSSMTIYAEELTVFLGHNNNELISTLCNWYDCEEDWEYDTIKRGDERIHGIWVTLIGGTTPSLIRSSLPPDSIGGGLTSRIIFVYAEEADKLSIFPTETPQQRKQFEILIQDLEAISLMTGDYKWTKGFMDLWSDWRYDDAKNPPFQDEKFDGYCGRRKVHLMKLAMIISAATRDDLVMTKDCLEEAVKLLVEVEQKMAFTFQGFGKSDIAELLFRANMLITRERREELPYGEFVRHFENDVDKFTLTRIIDTMEVMETIQVIRRPGAETIIKILRRNM